MIGESPSCARLTLEIGANCGWDVFAPTLYHKSNSLPTIPFLLTNRVFSTSFGKAPPFIDYRSIYYDVFLAQISLLHDYVTKPDRFIHLNLPKIECNYTLHKVNSSSLKNFAPKSNKKSNSQFHYCRWETPVLLSCSPNFPRVQMSLCYTEMRSIILIYSTRLRTHALPRIFSKYRLASFCQTTKCGHTEAVSASRLKGTIDYNAFTVINLQTSLYVRCCSLQVTNNRRESIPFVLHGLDFRIPLLFSPWYEVTVIEYSVVSSF